jgi:hypothetical protein
MKKCAECGREESSPFHAEENWSGDSPRVGAHPFEPEPNSADVVTPVATEPSPSRSAPTIRQMTPAERAADPGPIGKTMKTKKKSGGYKPSEKPPCRQCGKQPISHRGKQTHPLRGVACRHGGVLHSCARNAAF